jgi:hypothetical protein
MEALMALLKEKFKNEFDDIRSEIEAAYEQDVTEEVSGLKNKNGESESVNIVYASF